MDNIRNLTQIFKAMSVRGKSPDEPKFRKPEKAAPRAGRKAGKVCPVLPFPVFMLETRGVKNINGSVAQVAKPGLVTRVAQPAFAAPSPSGAGSEAGNSSKYIHGLHRRAFRKGAIQSGRLPHLKINGGTYFVTFRLSDSIPMEILRQFAAELAAAQNAARVFKPASKANKAGLETGVANADMQRHREHFRIMETWLDKGTGSCCLQRSEAAGIVADVLRFFDATRYELYEWVVMPNHVHALLKPLNDFDLGGIVKSWKQFTARRLKPLLGWTEKHFWQIESYDHWVRDADEKERIRNYIRRNPVKAGLCATPEEWPWSSAFVQFASGNPCNS
jgi:type I restriction enzyme R subunit/putative DNA methylase